MRLLQLSLLSALARADPDIVAFAQGRVLGSRTPHVRQFLGLPFAASTDGANKWQPPQPRAPWDFVLDCSAWGAGCTQPHHNPDVPVNQSLDCLNVNIFAPVLPPGALAPVLVFFNGGAFMEGSNQGPFGMYNGSTLAFEQQVVVVSANYRVGAFGYLATGREGVNGNFGLMDQVAALQWVQANIAAVGGNASSVTIFGEVSFFFCRGGAPAAPSARPHAPHPPNHGRNRALAPCPSGCCSPRSTRGARSTAR